MREELEKLLDMFTLEEILEINDMDVIDVLITLIQENGLAVPET